MSSLTGTGLWCNKALWISSYFSFILLTYLCWYFVFRQELDLICWTVLIWPAGARFPDIGGWTLWQPWVSMRLCHVSGLPKEENTEEWQFKLESGRSMQEDMWPFVSGSYKRSTWKRRSVWTIITTTVPWGAHDHRKLALGIKDLSLCHIRLSTIQNKNILNGYCWCPKYSFDPKCTRSACLPSIAFKSLMKRSERACCRQLAWGKGSHQVEHMPQTMGPPVIESR